jgi:two-component system, sporulation sensor kinase A
MEKWISQGYKDPLEQFINTNIGSDFSIFSEITDPYFIINLSGKIVYGNYACQLFLGYSNEELLQLELKDICSEEELNQEGTFFLKDDRERLTSFYLQIMKKGPKFIDIDVTCFPIMQNQRVIGTYVVFRDAQGMIVQQKKHYSTLIEHSPDSIFILKGRTIVDVSNAALSMLGTSMKEVLIGESIYLLLTPDSIELFHEKLQLVDQGKITDVFEQKMLTREGTEIEVEIKALPTVYNGESAYHIIVKNIGEQKKLTMISEKQAVAAQLAAGIAHEIRNPITAIKGFLKLIMAEQKKPNSYFKIIDSEIERIEVILRELMVLAKPSELKYEKLNVGIIVKNVLTLMESQALLNNIEIKQDINLENKTILADENQLKQVFINYIKNAIEAMPNGGRLFVEGTQNDEHICVKITDEGSGIPSEILTRIGEPFFTTKENGTGLGMIVSEQIVKEHKGRITINSDSGGTCIEINLPIIH